MDRFIKVGFLQTHISGSYQFFLQVSLRGQPNSVLVFQQFRNQQTSQGDHLKKPLKVPEHRQKQLMQTYIDCVFEEDTFSPILDCKGSAE